jgi:Na+-transporting methylmalonyl-CoA/oxaloacetate decarboxylase gamma subunit
MVVWVVIFLVVVYFIGRACMRFLDDPGDPETLAQFAKRMEEAEKFHKARVERIQKQMDETRKHMEEW